MTSDKPRKILRNFSFLTIGKVLGDCFTFLLFVVLSRVFGKEGIGQYSFAIAFGGFFAVFADFGLYNLSIKEVSRDTGRVGEYYSNIFMLRLSLAVVASVLLFALVLLIPFPADTKLIVALVGLYLIIFTVMDGFSAIFIACEDMHLASLMEFTFKAATSFMGIVIAFTTHSLLAVIVMLPAVTFAQLLAAYVIMNRKYQKLTLSYSGLTDTATLREAVPYVLSELLRQLSTRLDVVFLGFLIGAAAAGIYNVGYRVIFLLQFFPYYVGVALFPLASRLFVTAPEELNTLYNRSLNITILIGLPASCGLSLISNDLVLTIFGDTFLESVSILRILAGLLFLACMRYIMGTFLTSSDRQPKRTKSLWIAAVANALGNAILIPTVGIIGAAVATLFSEALLVFLFATQLRPIVGWPKIRSRLIISTIATSSFCIPSILFGPFSFIVLIPFSIILYAITLLAFKDIRQNEFQALMALIRSRFHRQTA